MCWFMCFWNGSLQLRLHRSWAAQSTITGGQESNIRATFLLTCKGLYESGTASQPRIQARRHTKPNCIFPTGLREGNLHKQSIVMIWTFCCVQDLVHLSLGTIDNYLDYFGFILLIFIFSKIILILIINLYWWIRKNI